MAGLLIGGAPVVTLHAEPAPDRPSIVEAVVLPGRGFMLLQARVALPSGERIDALVAPEPDAAAAALDGGAQDFAGNASFRFGGAILAPYANRIRGRALPDRREIETSVDGRAVRLPRNWGGQASGAEQYAMHGLILASSVPFEQPGPGVVRGQLRDGLAGWPGRLQLDFEWRLHEGDLHLRIRARNDSAEAAPFAAGWHPYLRLPSGDRSQARLHVPARMRAEVNDYDEVLPTGRLLEARGTAHDFTAPGGRALGDIYLDDCFVDLIAAEGAAVAEVIDPAAGLGFRLRSPAPPVRAIQVYAPPDRALVVVEPQFNLADPFGPQWPDGLDTGMQRLGPGDVSTYEVALSAFAAPQP
jgi:galactose mutarotase-like enzyme